MVIKLKENYDKEGAVLTHSDYMKNALNGIIDDLQEVKDNCVQPFADGNILKIVNCQFALEQLVAELAFFNQ